MAIRCPRAGGAQKVESESVVPAAKRRSREYSLSGDPLSMGGAARKKVKVKVSAHSVGRKRRSCEYSLSGDPLSMGGGGADAKEELSNERDAQGEGPGKLPRRARNERRVNQ